MDTDASGHHHNTTVIRFVEAAEAALVRERGIAGYFGVAPRVRQEINFEARLWFDQTVTCEVVLEKVGTTSMTFSFELWGEAAGEHPCGRAASGRFVVVYAPDPAGRARPWPAAWVEALTIEPACGQDARTGGPRDPRLAPMGLTERNIHVHDDPDELFDADGTPILIRHGERWLLSWPERDGTGVDDYEFGHAGMSVEVALAAAREYLDRQGHWAGERLAEQRIPE